MDKLILATTVIAIAAAAQLPPSTYLPAASGTNSGAPSSGSGNQHDASSKSINNGNTRPQQVAERSASILNLNNEANDNGFHYAYETSNGIQAEESGNAEQTRGGFAYKGDDGQIYSVTFTAGEDGFRPQGAHLPVPPPTPEEILLALKQNEKDEAAGIFDDGQYREDNNENKGKQGSSGSHQGSFNSNSGYSY